MQSPFFPRTHKRQLLCDMTGLASVWVLGTVALAQGRQQVLAFLKDAADTEICAQNDPAASFICPTCELELVRAAQTILADKKATQRVLVSIAQGDHNNVDRFKSAI